MVKSHLPGSQRISQSDEIERSRADLRGVNVIKPDDGDQHQKRAEHRVNKKLDRRIDAVFAAPDTNQEKQRNQGSLEKQVENQQIQRNENANHRAFEQQ